MCSECACLLCLCARFYGRCHLHSNLGFEVGGIHINFLRCTLCVLHQPLRCSSYYPIIVCIRAWRVPLASPLLNTVGSGFVRKEPRAHCYSTRDPTLCFWGCTYLKPHGMSRKGGGGWGVPAPWPQQQQKQPTREPSSSQSGASHCSSSAC